jgi:two-component system chemotaxis response regulator CheB
MRDIICVGASAGGVQTLSRLCATLPATLPATVFVVLHLEAHARSYLPEILARAGPLPARHAVDNARLEPGTIFIAPPDHHLLLERETMVVAKGPAENFARPAIDPLFRSAAFHHRRRVIGIVLSGSLDDGTAGLWAIKRRGGVAMVQDVGEALFPEMPDSALRGVKVDYEVPVASMGELLDRLCRSRLLPDRGADLTESLAVETSFASGQPVPRTALSKVAHISELICPECSGPLWEMKKGPRRFRCHVGHAFSPQSLFAAHSTVSDRSLWHSYRVVEEEHTLGQMLLRSETQLTPDAKRQIRSRLAICRRALQALRKHTIGAEGVDPTT